MAFDWTMMRNDLADDPAVISIAGSLNVDPDLIVGKMLRVWGWAGDHTTTGLVRNASALVIDHVAKLNGLARAMSDAGWLDLNDDNTVTFPRWKKWNAKSAKRRVLHQKRVAEKRARSVRSQSAHQAHEKRTREEKRRGYKTPLPPKGATEGNLPWWTLAAELWPRWKPNPTIVREWEAALAPFDHAAIDRGMRAFFAGAKFPTPTLAEVLVTLNARPKSRPLFTPEEQAARDQRLADAEARKQRAAGKVEVAS